MKITIAEAIQRTVEHREVFHDEMLHVMRQIMGGELTPAQIAGFIIGLRVKKETVGEIAAAAQVMREFATTVPVKDPNEVIDVVGTGGDAAHTFNVSTAAAFVAAAAGAKVAKHGNRAVSSRSGSADVLESLGAHVILTPEQIAACVEKIGIGFMFAPAHHPATKNVAATRVELATRTIFNLLGPLSNPAGVRRQMTGVFSRQWIEPVAQVLKALGSEAAWVAHGSDGLDEITTSGPTHVAALENGAVRTFEINPEDIGIEKTKPELLRGGDAESNAAALRAVLKGTKGPYRDIAVLNAAAALVVAGKAKDIKEGAAIAAKSIDSGEAEGRLERLIKVSNAQ